MKIGIWLGYDIKENAGGAFSYTDRLIQLIDEHVFPQGIDVCFVNMIGGGAFNKEVCSILDLPKYLISLVKKNNLLYRLVKCFVNFLIKKRGLKRMLAGKGISIIYYPHQGQCLDSNFPFIATNWDIGHRSTHAFPELMWDGKPFEVRENFYRNILPKALMIFCESEAGKKEIMQYANIGEHKIRVFPMFGGSVTTVKLSEDEGHKILNSYELREYEYFFYPAQFWAHKNHVGLVKAFAKIIEKYPNYKLVLSGSDKGNKDYVKFIISELDITDRVIFLGFVPIETVYCMYKYATALVMASHFGPTNMPPIEAMEIGCPVACSDLGGHREILGESACYFDSYDVDSIRESLLNIIKNNAIYRDIIQQQRQKSIYFPRQAMQILDHLLLEVKSIRDNWN